MYSQLLFSTLLSLCLCFHLRVTMHIISQCARCQHSLGGWHFKNTKLRANLLWKVKPDVSLTIRKSVKCRGTRNCILHVWCKTKLNPWYWLRAFECGGIVRVVSVDNYGVLTCVWRADYGMFQTLADVDRNCTVSYDKPVKAAPDSNFLWPMCAIWRHPALQLYTTMATTIANDTKFLKRTRYNKISVSLRCAMRNFWRTQYPFHRSCWLLLWRAF